MLARRHQREKIMGRKGIAAGVLAALGLGACAIPPPSGPSITALPPAGKDFAQFQREDFACQQAAFHGIGGGSPQLAANQAAVGSAVLGTALGATAGALLGAASGNAGAGAAVGAGVGLLGGSAVGAGQAQTGGMGLQRRYDVIYAQCMAASGNHIRDPRAVVTVVEEPYYYHYPPRPRWRGYYGYGGGAWVW
jgi:hypothetical protein